MLRDTLVSGKTGLMIYLLCENNGEENCSTIFIYVIDSSFYYIQFKEIEMIPMLTQFTFQ